jgi:hypothetical protein
VHLALAAGLAALRAVALRPVLAHPVLAHPVLAHPVLAALRPMLPARPVQPVHLVRPAPRSSDDSSEA